jgi:hypothetical protein
METFEYDGSADGLRKIRELQKSKTRIVCTRCGAELIIAIIALDRESANRHQVHPGVYCPNRHFYELLELRETRSAVVHGRSPEAGST